MIHRGRVILAADAPKRQRASDNEESAAESAAAAAAANDTVPSLASDSASSESEEAIETRASLLPGSYTIVLYGVYDAAAERAARSDGEEMEGNPSGSGGPTIRFKEPRYCNLTDWTSLGQGALDCDVPHMRAQAGMCPPTLFVVHP